MVHFISTYSLFRFSVLPKLYISQIFSVQCQNSLLQVLSQSPVYRELCSVIHRETRQFLLGLTVIITWKTDPPENHQNYMNFTGFQAKIQQTKMLVTCQRFGDLFLFGLVWQYSTNQNQYNEGRFKVMDTKALSFCSLVIVLISYVCLSSLSS